MYSIKETRKILLEINSCQNEVPTDYTDGTSGMEACTLERACDDCIMRLAGLIEWAEDLEAEDEKASKSITSSPASC